MYHDYSPLAARSTQLPEVTSPVELFQPFPTLSDGAEGIADVGQPIVFAAGQFKGSTIRMRLNELQKADIGRKYARVDRRPLDPPPIVHLTIFNVQGHGTEMGVETELDYENVKVSGFICTVDLFPVPDCFAPSQSHDFRAEEATNVSAEWQNQSIDIPNDIFLSPGTTTKVVHRLGDYPITESIKRTQSLAGATFVEAVKLEHRGKPAIFFAFSDLAVKAEGAFILRYRVFDLFSHVASQNDDAVVGAETYGGPFRVYSTKDFPGLRPSTDLTKNLARWGVRLNIRETERKKSKRSPDSP